MKNYIITLLAVLFISFSCSNEKVEESYTKIKGVISGYYSGKVFLSKLIDNKITKIDSAIVKKNKFEFKKMKFKEPELYYLIIGDGTAVIEFFIDKGEIFIEADMENNSKLSIKGSQAQSEYSSFLENNSMYETKQKRIFAQCDLALRNNDTAMLLHLDSAYKIIYEEQLDFIKKYTVKNNSSYVSAFIASRSLSNILSLHELVKISENFDKSLLQSIYLTELRQNIQKKENRMPGRQAPDFSIKDINGKQISLSSLQGKFFLIHFSASWSKASVAQIEQLKIIYNKYNKYGFEILSVSLEESHEDWQKYVKSNDINWLQTSELKGIDSDILKLYGITKLPFYILLDKKGKVMLLNPLISEINSILAQNFNVKN